MSKLLVATIEFRKNTSRRVTSSITPTIEFTRPLTAEEMRMLWNVEKCLNALPTTTRVHINVDEQEQS